MATDDRRRVPDQAEYEASAHETRWVELEDGNGAFEVREIPPLKLLRDVQAYDVEGLLNADDDGTVDVRTVMQDGDFVGFLEDTVLPNVVQPDVHWGDVGEGDFDLSALSPRDFLNVVAGMTGQDPAALEDELDDQFPG